MVINVLDDMESLEQLFFELASENRLTILKMLCSESLKMQEIANRLDVTATEVFRQLQRLSDVSLVERLPVGSFTITMYGRLVLHMSSSFDFIAKNREYFMGHDIWSIPETFINRLGELGETRLLETVDSFNKSVNIFLEAEEYAWGLSEKGVGPDYLDPLVDKRIEAGVPFRLMVPSEVLPEASQQNPSRNIEIRGFEECPAVIVLKEKEGIIFFKSMNGAIDYSGFYGCDSGFMGWLNELFHYYWSRASIA